HVRDEHGDEERAHAHGAALVDDVRLRLPCLEATDAGTDAGAGVLAGNFFLAQPGVLQRQLRTHERELHEAVESSCLPPVDVRADVHVDLTGYLYGEV